MRDRLYEEQIRKHVQKVVNFLEKYKGIHADNWDETDIYALERTLQLLIESCIGVARYYIKAKYDINVTKSREAFDELRHKGDLKLDKYEEMMKIIGFRNVLVHDYLEIEFKLMRKVIENRKYLFIKTTIEQLLKNLK